jgi:hypothetical protein
VGERDRKGPREGNLGSVHLAWASAWDGREEKEAKGRGRSGAGWPPGAPLPTTQSSLGFPFIEALRGHVPPPTPSVGHLCLSAAPGSPDSPPPVLSALNPVIWNPLVSWPHGPPPPSKVTKEPALNGSRVPTYTPGYHHLGGCPARRPGWLCRVITCLEASSPSGLCPSFRMWRRNEVALNARCRKKGGQASPGPNPMTART